MVAEPLSVFLYELNLNLLYELNQRHLLLESPWLISFVLVSEQHRYRMCGLFGQPRLYLLSLQDMWHFVGWPSRAALKVGHCKAVLSDLGLAKGLLVASFGTNLKQAFSECHLDYSQEQTHAQNQTDRPLLCILWLGTKNNASSSKAYLFWGQSYTLSFARFNNSSIQCIPSPLQDRNVTIGRKCFQFLFGQRIGAHQWFIVLSEECVIRRGRPLTQHSAHKHTETHYDLTEVHLG